MDQLLCPKSIAIIGASRKEGSLGKMFLDAMQGMSFYGTIYIVNPKASEINGINCYPDIESLPEIPDLAIILLAKNIVLDAVKSLAKKGVKNVIVISAGFREVSEEGEKEEQSLLDIVKKNNMRMLGPNCMGVFNTDPHISLNATFSPTPPIPGHVSFISQSGALGVAVLELSRKIGLGFSIFVSTGNKADIDDGDILRFLKDDKNTKTVILYQESIDKPNEFRKICSEVIPKKPVFSLKSGCTESGLHAASSHTGALASNDVVTDAFLKQCGVIRCETLQELLDSAYAMMNQPLPKGNRVAVITNAGGPGILASDALEKEGLQLAKLSNQTISELKKELPAEAGLTNPIDMIASANQETYRQVCKILDQDENVDALFVIIVKPPIKTTPKEIILHLSSIVENSKKPFFFTLMAQRDEDAGIEVFQKLKVPVYSYPESAAKALGNIFSYKEIKNSMSRIKIDDRFSLNQSIKISKGKYQVQFEEVASLLQKYNLPITQHIITNNVNDAVSFHKKVGTVALKIVNEEIIHKSDLNMVRLNLSSESAIKENFLSVLNISKNHLPKDKEPQILVQKMVKEGIELVLGCNRDPVFGPVVMFGVGGVFVELYKDVAFRVLPLTLRDAKSMINEIKGKKLLEGFRNYPAVDLDKLASIIVRFSIMIEENPDIIEVDLNPVIWSSGDQKPIFVDCRMTKTL